MSQLLPLQCPQLNKNTFLTQHTFLTTALCHIIFSVTKLTNSEYWIFFIRKVLLSNHQKFCLTWLINQNLFCLIYRRCSIQAGRHCLGEVREDILPNNDCWTGAPDTLSQEKVCQHETGWSYCVVVRGGEGLQSHKSCEHQSSRWKSLRCCSGSRIWWRCDEI